MSRKYYPPEQFSEILAQMRRDEAALRLARQMAEDERAGRDACELALAARREPEFAYAI